MTIDTGVVYLTCKPKSTLYSSSRPDFYKELFDAFWIIARNEEKGREAIKELEKLGLKANYHQLDIESSDSIQKLAAYLKQTYGGLDLLINNAAVAKIVSHCRVSVSYREVLWIVELFFGGS